MRDRKLATRYARALLGALPDPASQDRADAFLAALERAIADSSELRSTLHDPAVPKASKTAVLEALAERHQASPLVVRFLETVGAHGRFASLPSIAEVFHEERERAQGIVTAQLTAAASLPDDLRVRAEAALARLAGKTVRLEVDVDPDLLGGAVAKVGSMVYDGSLKTQLDRLRKQLGEG
jgi:F-type H+-transporting ATPase subunit delta